MKTMKIMMIMMMNPWRSRVAFKPIGMFPFMHNIKRWDPIEWMLPSSTTKANKSTYLRWAARGSTAERRKINRRLSNIETTASRLWGVTAIRFVRGGRVAEIRRHDAQYCKEKGHRSTAKDTESCCLGNTHYSDFQSCKLKDKWLETGLKAQSSF